jgi:hypothetical protein
MKETYTGGVDDSHTCIMNDSDTDADPYKFKQRTILFTHGMGIYGQASHVARQE